jgi:hypothetical protein
VPTRWPMMGCRAPPVLVAIKERVGICVVSELLAVPSRKTGAPTVVAVELSVGRVISVKGALTAVTFNTMAGDATTVLPVSSVATITRLNRPAVLAV